LRQGEQRRRAVGNGDVGAKVDVRSGGGTVMGSAEHAG